MTKAKLIIAICLGVLLGAGVASTRPINGRLLIVIALCAMLWLVLRWYAQARTSAEVAQISQRVSGWKVCVLAVPYVLLGVVVGVWRTEAVLAVPSEFAAWYGQKQDFDGLVVAEADVRQDRQLVTVQPRGFGQRVLVTTTLGREFHYGDLVWVKGKVVEPRAFDDFDYPGYLARFSTFALARYPKIVVLKSARGNVVVQDLLRFKTAVTKRLLSLYQPVEGNFLLGVLIGAKRGLPQRVLDDFARSGTSHILAVSGFNISIFISALGVAAYVVGRRWQLLLAIVSVSAFIVIAGPSSSVVRAAGMGLLLVLSTTVGRLYNPLPALLLVAACMVMQNPRILFWDIGFQLSAAATAGILLGVPFVERWYGGDRPFAGIVHQLGVTLSAIIATVPISLLHFSQLSLVAPIVNLIVVPFVPLIMILGALSLLPILGVGFAFVNGLLLRLELDAIMLFARIPWASVDVSLSGWAVFACYGTLALVYACLHLRQNGSTKAVG